MLQSNISLKWFLITSMVFVFFATIVWGQETPNVSDKFHVVEMFWTKRNLKNIAKRVQVAAEFVANREIKGNQLYALMHEREAWNHWISAFEAAPELKVKIFKDYDEVRVINRSLIDKLDGEDIGEKQAIEIAAKYLEKFGDSGVLNHKAYNLDDVQVGYGKVGGGTLDGREQYEGIVEYRVTFRPNMGGIQLANAGVRLAIHRSGVLSGVRLGGVSAKKTGKTAIRKVSSEKIEERFRRMIPDNAKPAVVWSRVMYVMPENKRRAVVEPLKVFSFALISESDGEHVVSRRKILGFSLTDEKAKVIDFTAPARQHEGTKVERKAEETGSKY